MFMLRRRFCKCQRQAIIQCRARAVSSMSVQEVSMYGSGWEAGPGAVKVSVWWDFENCNIPLGVSPSKIGNNIVSALRLKGFRGPVSITAYGDTWQLSRSTQEALAGTGISLHHLPSTDRKTDTTLMVDLVLWTLDHPPPAHLFVISTDSELSSALHSLRMKNYNVLLACNSHAASPALLAAATSVWQWGKLAAGEGLVLQLTVDSKDAQTPREFLRDLSRLSPPPLRPPAQAKALITTVIPVSTQGSTDKSSEVPGDVATVPKADPLDDFHKDVCMLLQQAASSLNERAQDNTIRVSGKLRTKAGQDGNTQTTEVSVEQTTKEPVTSNSYSVTRIENVSSQAAEDGESTSSEKVTESSENGTASPSEPSHPHDELKRRNEPLATDDDDSGKWTWTGFFFGRRNTSSTHAKAEETELPASTVVQKRSWLGNLWKGIFQEPIASEQDLCDYLSSEEAAFILSKSRNQKEFVQLLYDSGPEWMRDWQEDQVCQVVDALVAAKAIDTSPWLEDADASAHNKTLEESDAAADKEKPECTVSSFKTANQRTWDSGKGYHPSIQELRLWLVYLLEVEHEGRSFDVSLLKLEFKRNFGLSLNVHNFGCVRMKELLAMMQDQVHIQYPRPTVCTIRSKFSTASREKKFQSPSSLADYSALLEELFMDYPTGIPVSMIKARFYAKFNCDIDHRILGYSTLGEFLTASRRSSPLAF